MKRVEAIIITIVIALSMICVACGNTPSERLDAPTNLRVQGSTLEWDAVENANGYTVYAAGKEYETNECTFDLSELSGPDTYKIEVMAIGNGIRYDDSLWATYTYTVTPTEPIVPTENLAYTLLADGSGYEVSRGKADLTGRVVIPDEHKGLPVKKIADEAFDVSGLNADPYTGKGCNTKTTGFRLPETLEEIGEFAFAYCTALTEITIPESVNIIGGNVFQYDIKLRQVKLPSTLTYIPKSIFVHCESLASIEIPQTVREIKPLAFNCCKSLKEIKLPKNLQILESSVFENCSSLTEIIIPNGIKRLEHSLFENCTALIDIEFPSKIDYMGWSIITGTAWLNEQPDGFVTINDWLVTYKGEIPNGGVIDRFPSEIQHIAGSAFAGCEVVSVVLPDGVDCGSGLFYQCEYLTDVQLPNDLEIIPSGMFKDCKSLKSINIPNSVTKIQNNAFDGCINLMDVKIPNSVTEIGYNAFFICKSITSLIIPKSVNVLDVSFDCCNNLTHLYYEDTEQQWNDNQMKAGIKKEYIYYYAETENDIPESGGNYWHYDVDGQTPVIWRNE